MAATQLKGVGLMKRNESLMAANAGMGLAVGRHLLGTSLFNIGKRFEYLLDGDVGSALYPGRGPAITLPSNAAAAAQVVTHNVSLRCIHSKKQLLGEPCRSWYAIQRIRYNRIPKGPSY